MDPFQALRTVIGYLLCVSIEVLLEYTTAGVTEQKVSFLLNKVNE